MKFKFDPRAGRMVGSRTQILQRHEIERLGGVIPDNRHISPGTAYIPEKDVMQVKAAARRDGVEVTRLNDYDKDIGGGLYRFEKTTTFESGKDMKKLNENTKITLTLGQLKRLVKESKAWPKEIEYDDEEIDMPMSKPARGRSKAASTEAGPEDRILDLLEDIEAAGYNIVSPYSGSVGRRLYNVLGHNPKKADQDFQKLQDMVDAHDLTDVVRLRKSSSTSNAYYKYGITGRQAFSISWDNKYKAGLKELNQRKEDRKGSRLHMTSRYKDAHGKSGAAKSRHWQRQLGWLD